MLTFCIEGILAMQLQQEKSARGVLHMVDMSNAWPNYWVGIIWVIAFIVFVIAKYPGHKGEDHK